MRLTPAQADIARDTHRFRVVDCGRRFGKTILAAWEMFGLAVAQDDRRVLYTAPTFQQARDIAWNELKKICRPVLVSANESRLELTIKTQDGGQSLIYLRGWEAIDSARGQKNDFIVPDEVAMYRYFWEGWNEVLRPTLTDRRGGALFLSTPKGFNHFYDLYNLEAKDKDFKSFHFTTYDNPHIPVEEIDKARQQLTDDQFAQEYMADFRKMEGLVYPEFSRERHLFDDITDKGTIVSTLQGIDWGFRHPAAVITIEKSANGHYWVFDEWIHTGKTEEDAIEYARARNATRVYPDPENASAVEKCRRAGMNVSDVIKGKGSVKSGISSVNTLFKEGRLHISKSLIGLITALETHAFKEGSEEPEEVGKDPCDALRYPLMMDAPNGVEDFTEQNFSLYRGTYQ